MRFRAAAFILALFLSVTATAEPVSVPSPNFDTLSNAYPCVAGWLYSDLLQFSQPIVQGTDNESYLTKTYDNHLGKGHQSIFLDYRTKNQDEITWIYGSGKSNGYFSFIFDAFDSKDPSSFTDLVLTFPDEYYNLHPIAITHEKNIQADSLYGKISCSTDLFSYFIESSTSPIFFIDSCENAYSNKKIAALCAIRNKQAVILWFFMDICSADSTFDPTKTVLDSVPTISGPTTVGSLGTYYNYAQNDPVWAGMRYESAAVSRVYRNFSGGGCGPTAAATIIANLVRKDHIKNIENYLLRPISICPCSVNGIFCNGSHMPYYITETEEYIRYLPAVMANFAAGNNIWEMNARRDGGTGTFVELFEYICKVYDLESKHVYGLEQALDMLVTSDTKDLVLCYALHNSPFSNGSHYVVLAGADNEYFYILDPWFRDDYSKTDYNKIAEVIGNGVARIRLKDMSGSDVVPNLYIKSSIQ